MNFRTPVSRALALGLALCSLLPAAEPDDVLRRLVDADAGLCVELSGLQQHWPELAGSELAGRLRQSAAYRRWMESADYRKLSDGEKRLESLFGRPTREVLGDLFGHSVVLAIYPSPDEHAAGVLLVNAANDLVIQEAVDIWNAAEGAQLETLPHAGQAYVRRTRPRATGDPRSQFYWTSGAVFALSDNEAVIRRVIDLASSPSQAASILTLPEYERAARSLPRSGAVWVWFNPRAWDHVALAGDSLRKPLGAVWNRCESIAARLLVDRGVVIEAVAHYDQEGVPDQWSHLIRTIAGPVGFLDRVPRRALFAVAGRHGLACLDQWIAARLEATAQGRSTRQVGRGFLGGLDPVTDLLAAFEPDWGAYVVPREAGAADRMPVDAVVALRLSIEDDELLSAVDAGLRHALATLALFHNAQGPKVAAVVRSQPGDTGTVHWVEGIDKWQPAAALTADSLVFGTSPEAVVEFGNLKPDESLSSDAQFRRWRSELFPGKNQVAFANIGAIRRLLQSRREFFIADSVRSESIGEAEAESRLAELQDLLALADGAVLAASLDEESLRLTFGLLVDEPVADAEGSPR